MKTQRLHTQLLEQPINVGGDFAYGSDEIVG